MCAFAGRDDVIYEAFRKAGRPIKLGFITYKPPQIQQFVTADSLLNASTVEVEEKRATNESAYNPRNSEVPGFSGFSSS